MKTPQGGCLHKLGALTIGPQVLCRNSVGFDPHYKIHLFKSPVSPPCLSLGRQVGYTSTRTIIASIPTALV